ncbi:MAG: AzlD domain-containing protein [Acidobacteria bacterium]|jgi:branched-subunit amino acid transport protein|nr:AzlD domain-containing protein [Acidobacteriota bacterium]
MGRIKGSPFVERWLRYLPGSLMLAIITPGLINGGLIEVFSAVVVAVVMIASRNLLLAMIAGIGMVYLFRNFI